MLKRGKVMDRFKFSLDGVIILSITVQPVKSLCNLFDCSRNDSASIQKTSKDLELWLSKVDKSGLLWKFKAWIYQHSIPPWILWPLLVYEVPITTVQALERKISNYLRRWPGLPRSLSSASFCGTNNDMQLPISSLAEEFMVSIARGAW